VDTVSTTETKEPGSNPARFFGKNIADVRMVQLHCLRVC
jgi:hypothetical protein